MFSLPSKASTASVTNFPSLQTVLIVLGIIIA
jgi:hypothetical protein